MIHIKDIEPGKSYACRFRAEVMLDTQGLPAPTGYPLSGPGVYEGLGVILQRDTEQRLVRLRDTQTHKEFVVLWDDCWDVDTVEWRDSNEPAAEES